ncbi:MAG: asparaginase [Anaerolineales bacterium]|nr:asparaginase [Anaerolineales bacterium]
MSDSLQYSEHGYLPLFLTTRGETVESIHYGSIAIVDNSGNLYAHYGNPDAISFLRSSAKPFQSLPLVEMNGLEIFNITEKELSITCASHSGTDLHLQTIYGLQQKIGISENDLLCCTHQPFDPSTRALLRDRGEQPSPNHHNCSGKHTGMLAQAKLLGATLEKYTEIEHPVQQQIRTVFAEMCSLEPSQIHIGRDGCSVPTFAVPLYHVAWGWARLVNPDGLSDLRKFACQKIISSMVSYPFQVAGPGRLDTRLMNIAVGKVISKAGAEAFQSAGIPKNVISPGSPALGIALKIADGDQGKRARRAVMIEILNQLGVLSSDQQKAVSDLGPEITYHNQCGFVTGVGKPCFQLQYS